MGILLGLRRIWLLIWSLSRVYKLLLPRVWWLLRHIVVLLPLLGVVAICGTAMLWLIVCHLAVDGVSIDFDQLLQRKMILKKNEVGINLLSRWKGMREAKGNWKTRASASVVVWKVPSVRAMTLDEIHQVS